MMQNLMNDQAQYTDVRILTFVLKSGLWQTLCFVAANGMQPSPSSHGDCDTLSRADS